MTHALRPVTAALADQHQLWRAGGVLAMLTFLATALTLVVRQ